MNWIQVLLIAAIVALFGYLLRSRTSAKSQAWVKVSYIVFVVVAIYAILRPDQTTVVAHWLGVARGTDLMLYVLIVASIFTTLSTYMRFRDVELQYARLARAVALQTAQAPGAPDAGWIAAATQNGTNSDRIAVDARSTAPAGNTPRCDGRRHRAGPADANPAPARPG